MENVNERPEFSRDDDGELLMDWSPSKGRMVSLSLRNDGRLSYAVTWDGETMHGTEQQPPSDEAAAEAWNRLHSTASDPAEIVLNRIGRVEIEGGEVILTGFEGDNCSCRDVATLALSYAIGVLQGELDAMIRKPGGTGKTGIG
jgi:hypothetical protein